MYILNELFSRMIPLFPEKLIWVFAKKYIAGNTLESAVSVSGDLNREGASVTVDLLGESNDDPSRSESYKQKYIQIIENLDQSGIEGNCSLKPTMFGLAGDPEACYGHIRDIISFAHKKNRFVRIDMEDSTCVDAELTLLKKLKKEFPEATGPVFQAYLRRTGKDLENILDLKLEGGLSVRLCKGIYDEQETVAYKEHDQINLQYMKYLEYLLLNGVHTCIATHDETLIKEAVHFIKRFNISPDLFEFQMLYGVTPHLKKNLIDRGYSVRIYVPFGKEWMLYSVRRLKENPKMISYIIKSLFV